jgi:hypothetical protein
MKALNAVSCWSCRHFMHDARALEGALPGLASLSSAYAAVRADDGLCNVHDRYIAGSSSCVRYLAAAAA